MYVYSLLLGKILNKFNSRYEFALELGVTPQTLINKLKNRQPWDQHQIEDCCKLLEIPRSQIVDYFFTLDVARKETRRSKMG